MKFTDFPFSKQLIDNLTSANYIDLLDVQVQALKTSLKHRDLLIKSMTGSGKTLVYLLPAIQYAENNKKSLIILPTSLLKNQLIELAKSLTYNLNIIISSNANADILIIDSFEFKEKYIASKYMNEFTLIVIDEVDMFFENTASRERIDIFKSFSSKAQIILLSSSISRHLRQELFAKLKNGLFIETNKEISSTYLKNYLVELGEKTYYSWIIEFSKIMSPILSVIFVNTKEEASTLYKELSSLPITYLSSDLLPKERNKRINEIKALKYKYIISTDLGARGIDIDIISDVVSCGLPNNLTYYYHRLGRTGRNKKMGRTFTLYSEAEKAEIARLDRELKYERITLNSGEIEKKKTFKFSKNKQSSQKTRNKIIRNKKLKVKPNYKKKLNDEFKKEERKEYFKKSRNFLKR